MLVALQCDETLLFRRHFFECNMQPTQPANQFCYSEILAKHTQGRRKCNRDPHPLFFIEEKQAAFFIILCTIQAFTYISPQNLQTPLALEQSNSSFRILRILLHTPCVHEAKVPQHEKQLQIENALKGYKNWSIW